jgi:3-deoxy-7-phosphoheptulonate synthase
MNLHLQYPLLARNPDDRTQYGFTYQGIKFAQTSFNIFAGLNAVDNPQNVELTFKALQQNNLTCARMGAFKPRTSPYSFQGLGEQCLPYVFDLAATYGIKIIAMEITHAAQLDFITNLLIQQNNPTRILVQIGTRNAQNFELLKAVGAQQDFPVLYKRGYGITLQESIAACEYLAQAGNERVIFCLRGMKSQFSYPQRNFVDFAQVPAIKRLTKMSVCIDPSHSVGNMQTDLDGVPDLFHATAQGIIAGANMLLIDVHPKPSTALVDAQQAIALDQLPTLLDDIALCRRLYLQRREQYLFNIDAQASIVLL